MQLLLNYFQVIFQIKLTLQIKYISYYIWKEGSKANTKKLLLKYGFTYLWCYDVNSHTDDMSLTEILETYFE
jgi:hypothetical protein